MDSNHDEENQNPVVIRRKPNKHNHIDNSDSTGCSAGRSRKPTEGGISDPDLAALVAMWPTLPDPIKAAIRAMIGTVTGQ